MWTPRVQKETRLHSRLASANNPLTTRFYFDSLFLSHAKVEVRFDDPTNLLQVENSGVELADEVISGLNMEVLEVLSLSHPRAPTHHFTGSRYP